MTPNKRMTTGIGVVVLTALMSASAAAVETVFQALDSVKVYSLDRVLSMPFDAYDDPLRTDDFIDTGIAGDAFVACKLTAIDGLYCLDGKKVYHWPDVEDPADRRLAVDCEDPALNLDTRKVNTCTGMTVDLNGSIWLAGKNKGKSHSLVQVIPDPGTCPGDYAGLATPYCAKEIASGRPLLVDITSVDGDAAAAFPDAPGILGLEERKTAVFFPAAGAPVELASGKNDFGLAGGEQLLSIALLQTRTLTDEVVNHILVTTDLGRVLLLPVAGGTATPVYDIAGNRPAGSMTCSAGDASYGIRVSSKSGTVYVTDYQYCLTVALQPDVNEFGQVDFSAVVPAVLSTADASVAYAPLGPTVAPGINIDLRDCGISCTLVFASSGAPAATLSNVQLNSQESGLTLFQLKNIPDCRYIPSVCVTLLDEVDNEADLFTIGVVVDPDSTGLPKAQLLNLTALLPAEITGLFTGDDELPPMYLDHAYRGQSNNGFTFEAFFGITEDGVVFRSTFEGVFDVGALAGSELGCELGLDDASPLYTTFLPGTTTVDQYGTLNWDVLNTVSETYVSRVDPSGRDRVTTMVNTGCGSSKMTVGRWSMKPYNLEVTPCSYNGDATDVWASDGSCPEGGPELPDDAVLAKLLLKLFDEWYATLTDLACTDADGDGTGLAPLSSGSCASIEADWLNAKDKLDKCWDAMQTPKESSGSQNCQAFVSQLSNLEAGLAAAPLYGPDMANRKGELGARLRVIWHLYEDRVVPSIPEAGFVE